MTLLDQQMAIYREFMGGRGLWEIAAMSGRTTQEVEQFLRELFATLDQPRTPLLTGRDPRWDPRPGDIVAAFKRDDENAQWTRHVVEVYEADLDGTGMRTRVRYKRPHTTKEEYPRLDSWRVWGRQARKVLYVAPDPLIGPQDA